MPESNAFGQQVGDAVPGWTPRPRPSAVVVLDGVHTRLEPIGPGHVPALFAATCGSADDDLWTYRPTERPREPSELAAIVAELAQHPEWVTFAIVVDEAAVGFASLMRIEPSVGQVEVGGVLFGRPLQRTTAATEAIHLLLRLCFDDLGYRRFEWKCDSLNEPSRTAAARLGFVYEGRFRQHLVVKGRNRDTDWFSITDTEWPVVRAAHAAWLAPSNFDAAGRQRSKLSVPRATVDRWSNDSTS